MKARFSHFVFVSALVLAVSVATRVEARPVLQVIAVKVTGDVDSYLEKLKKFQAVSKRLGLPPARMWRATLAGDNTGTVFIAAEYPSLAAYAEGTSKLDEDKEWQKVRKDLDKSGIRTLQSMSLLTDVTP